jgi:hypothetical protein
MIQKYYDDPALRQSETDWRQHSAALERMIEEAEEIPVGQLIGQTAFLPIETIAEVDVAAELEKVLGVLAQAGIFIDFLFDPEPAEIYQFVTGRLLDEPIADVQFEGHAVVFIYELANPSSESNAKICAQTYLTAFFLGHDDVRRTFMAADHLHDRRDRPLARDQFEADIREFQRKFPKIGDFELKAQSVRIQGDRAMVDIQTHWQATGHDEAHLKVICGLSKISLRRHLEQEWLVTGMQLAGWRSESDGKM